MAVSTRIGGTADHELIARHDDAARRESARYRGRIPSRHDEGVDPDLIVIGCVGQTEVGSLVAFRQSGSEWLIQHVYVEDDFRQIGVADALVAIALSELSARGATHVRAHAQPGDRSLKNLFERHGLVAETITVGRALGG